MASTITDSTVLDPTLFQQRAAELGFDASCDSDTGSLLLTLAASKPGGRFLELGTGIGFGTMHLLAGMDAASHLDTVELSETLSMAAQSLLQASGRATFTVQDGCDWILDYKGDLYDFIFADTWPGKFSELAETLALLAPGGIYFIDDLLPQPNWPQGHQGKVDALRLALESQTNLLCTSLDWATGLMICVRAGENA